MNDYEFDRLPELPLELFEMAGKLDHAGDEPTLTVIHDKLQPPQPPANPTAVPIAQTYMREYLTQVTYPKLVCYPRGDLVDRVAFKPVETGESQRNMGVVARSRAYFKLTGIQGDRFKLGYYCTVHYGPWSALVREEGSCLQGVPPLWRLFVASIPDLELAWYGSWEDIPSYPNLTVIMGDLHLMNEATLCCPGYRWCAATQSCIDISINVDCDDISPV